MPVNPIVDVSYYPDNIGAILRKHKVTNITINRSRNVQPISPAGHPLVFMPTQTMTTCVLNFIDSDCKMELKFGAWEMRLYCMHNTPAESFDKGNGDFAVALFMWYGQ